jgi:ABC-type multidrug transport system fused ATPase/permease subunit
VSGVLSNRMSFFDTTPLGRIINRFSADMDQVRQNQLDSILLGFFLKTPKHYKQNGRQSLHRLIFL